MGTPDICLRKNLDQRPIGLQQTCPDGAESTVDLEMMADDVTLSDGRSLGERAPTRRAARPCAFGRSLAEARRSGRSVPGPCPGNRSEPVRSAVICGISVMMLR